MNVIQPTHTPGSLVSHQLVGALNPGAGQTPLTLEQNSEGSDLETLAAAGLQSVATSVSLKGKGKHQVKEGADRLPFPGTDSTLKERRSKVGRPRGSCSKLNANSSSNATL